MSLRTGLRFDRKLLMLGFSVVLVSSLLTTWHYDFDRLGSIPFGIRALTYSLFFDKSICIDNFWESAGADFSWYNGHYYLGYPPLTAFVTLPFLAVEQLIVYLVSHLFGFMNGHVAWLLESWFLSLPQALMFGGIAILLFKLLKRFMVSSNLAFLSSWLLAFTTYGLVYTTGANNDLTAAFLVFFGFYILTGEVLKPWQVFFGSLITSFAVLAQYPSILYAGFWFLIIVLRHRKESLTKYLIPYSLGCLIPLALLSWYHTIVFGAPWHFAHEYHAYKVAFDQTAANKIDFSIANIPNGLRGLLLSPVKGLFIYAPLSIFSLVGLKAFWGRLKLESLPVFLGITGMVVLYSLWWDWSGGFDFSSRYLISILPFIFLVLAFGLTKILTTVYLRIPFITAATWGLLSTLVFTFTGIRETIRMENWRQLAVIGRFESFFKVIQENNPRDVAPIIVRFGHEWPLVSNLPYSTLSIILFATVVVIALLPLVMFLRSSAESKSIYSHHVLK